MGGTGRHTSASASVLWAPGRFRATAAITVLVTVTGMIAAVLAVNSTPVRSVAAVLVRPASAGPAARVAAGSAESAGKPEAIARAEAVPVISSRKPPTAAALPQRATMPLVLTAVDHRDCPAAATACVDLARHISWLQRDGRTAFGPVRMEPGRPGSAHQTPRGTFQVGWKAGPSYMSNTYNEPMPWATFFGPGGIAFHGGSLTSWSHGCVHLTNSNAHYYHEHLPIGAEVVVF